ncbi:ABC transporter substrate-binding protein [Desulfosporosinus fructosivorans]|uniref:ABC transporter substrate-binding protein n=1 Tax=Desulfosporosinus fructosivorans TaxID=2018669 RepID=A0A4Z0R4W3_9FIRM|nr:ABC transporter substrate-binding protein [Desulfosporosinus fructosivorans]TGE38141.1 ABC transporter substrate-binding protein [Desulfosporosinus fructosivorans]
MSKKKSLALIALILCFTLLLAGCGSTTPKANMPTDENLATPTTYPLTINDDSGSSVTLVAQPKRIVSLVPSATETLFALGLGDNVVAVTKWDNYPVGVQEKVDYAFEDSIRPNTEQILELEPDLIVMGLMGNDQKDIEAIRNLKIPVVTINPQTLVETYQTIEMFGKLTDSQEQAHKIVSGMKEKERVIVEKIGTIKDIDRLKVWIEVDENLYTPGEGTFLNELLTKAGGKNIAVDVQGWGQFNSEQVIAKDPQVIFSTYGYYQKDAVAKIIARKGWQNVQAVKNERVIELDSDMVTRTGPRIVDGLESIAKALYPELFK